MFGSYYQWCQRCQFDFFSKVKIRKHFCINVDKNAKMRIIFICIGCLNLRKSTFAWLLFSSRQLCLFQDLAFQNKYKHLSCYWFLKRGGKNYNSVRLQNVFWQNRSWKLTLRIQMGWSALTFRKEGCISWKLQLPATS